MIHFVTLKYFNAAEQLDYRVLFQQDAIVGVYILDVAGGRLEQHLLRFVHDVLDFVVATQYVHAYFMRLLATRLLLDFEQCII